MTQMKEWIARYWANHKDIPEGHHDGEVVAELIRCKDCKWNTAVEWVHCAMVGGMFGRTTDNYCSRAERKEE